MYHVGINHIIQIQFFPQASVCYPKKEGKKVKIQKKIYDQFFQVSFPTGYEL